MKEKNERERFFATEFEWRGEYEMNFGRYLLAVLLPSSAVFLLPLCLALVTGEYVYAITFLVLSFFQYGDVRDLFVKKFGKPYLRPVKRSKSPESTYLA